MLGLASADFYHRQTLLGTEVFLYTTDIKAKPTGYRGSQEVLGKTLYVVYVANCYDTNNISKKANRYELCFMAVRRHIFGSEAPNVGSPNEIMYAVKDEIVTMLTCTHSKPSCEKK